VVGLSDNGAVDSSVNYCPLDVFVVLEDLDLKGLLRYFVLYVLSLEIL
jgi:hypothetical protein